jgi:hypothetical protein
VLLSPPETAIELGTRRVRLVGVEIRAILQEAVSKPEPSDGLFTTLMDRFGAIGGVDLDLPPRSTPPRRWAAWDGAERR